MRILSDINNTGNVDGFDIGNLDVRISSNNSSISTNSSNISSLQTNVSSLSSTLSTKAAITDLATASFNGSPLGKISSIDIDEGSNTVNITAAGGTVQLGVIFATQI
tara:strand:+ start:1146 stop:1466 length:321 start_codon:yes stop_codon:yes gene_type:complete